MRSPGDENEIITPAVEGVKNVMKAVKEAKCVKRVVLTSAGLAIIGYYYYTYFLCLRKYHFRTVNIQFNL